MKSRREPTFGPSGESDESPDALHIDDRPRRRERNRPDNSAWPWLIVLAVLLALGVAAYAFRDELADRLLPASQQTRLIGEAEIALAEGRLSSPDGRGARELFTAVLALDPDHATARDGLRRVADAALARARERLAANDDEGVREALALARTLAAPAADIAAVEQVLRRREAEESQLARLLESAERARRAGRLDGGADSAVSLYRQALAAAPDSAIARAGLHAVLAELLREAAARLGAGDQAAALTLVARVESIDASHIDLPALKARLAEHSQASADTLAKLFEESEAARRDGRLEEARDGYRAVLLQRPDHAGAKQGLEQIVVMLAQQAIRLASDFRFEDAELRLAEARELSPTHPAVREAESRLLQARARASEVAEVAVEAAPRADVDRLLAQAADAVAAQRFVEPPGESAWDILRNARSLAPNDERIYRAMEALVPAAKRCVEDDLRTNRLSHARICLNAIAAMDPAASDLGELRRRLAARWIGFGEERLGAGEFDAAQRAYRTAREIDPGHPGLAAFAARLDQASLAQPY